MVVYYMVCNCKGCELMYVNFEKVIIIMIIVSFILFLEILLIFVL